MLAAEHLVGDGSTSGFDRKWRASEGGHELRRVRNIKPGFKHGLWWGLANAAFESVTAGLAPWTLAHGSNRALHRLDEYASPERDWGPRTLPPRDRSAFVFFAQTTHREDQPVHLRVADTGLCSSRCATEYGNPCTRFCPVGVYEMIDDGAGGRRLQVNAANCVHCKACDIKDPYAVITWTTPEGGSGPNYSNL
jgi:electron-transferring-flavoprotein dehydrogenase